MDSENSGNIGIPSVNSNETNTEHDAGVNGNVMDVIGNGQLMKKVRQFGYISSAHPTY